MDAMSPSQRSKWQMTGELPERLDPPVKDEEPSASSPDTQAQVAPVTDASENADASATAAVADPEPKPKGGHRGNADTRVPELQTLLADIRAERQQLAAERAALQRPQTEVPASSATAAPITPQDDPRPKLEDFADYDEYAVSLAQWGARQELKQYTANQQREADDRQRTEKFTRTAGGFVERMIAAAKADSTLMQRIDQRFLEIPLASTLPKGVQPKAENIVIETAMDSEHSTQLLEHFSAHPEDFSRLCASQTESAFHRAFGRLESAVGSPARAAAPLKTVSDAPAPGTTLGARVTDPIDPVEGALKRKDPAAYMREMNKRELAATKG